MREPNCTFSQVSAIVLNGRMLNSTDLYLGTFLVLCGFVLSLLNLRRLVKKNNVYSSVLLSENVLLLCIGIAFISRAVYQLNPVTMDIGNIEKRMAGATMDHGYECNIWSIVLGYGPFILSLVNSFLTLIIDNYMHYRMLETMQDKNEEQIVQDFSQISERVGKSKVNVLFVFWKKYFSFIAIALQWLMPVLMTLFMYLMHLQEKIVHEGELRSFGDSCMAMVDVTNQTCADVTNYTVEFRKPAHSSGNYLELYEDAPLDATNTAQINSIIQNVQRIVDNLYNKDMNVTVTSKPLYRIPKLNYKCVKVCFMKNKSLLSYMFVLAVVSYFVPITISTMILTKIHGMDVTRPNLKTYANRELLYNILFWTPVMFDTLLSLIFCSFSMNGMRMSMFNVIANIYQAVKNFMNTKYFKDNVISPS